MWFIDIILYKRYFVNVCSMEGWMNECFIEAIILFDKRVDYSWGNLLSIKLLFNAEKVRLVRVVFWIRK